MNVTPKKPRGRPSLTPRQVPQAAPQIYLPSTPAPDPQPTAQAAPPKPMHQPAAPQPPPFPAPPLPPFPAINQEAAAAAQPPLFGPLALLPARNDPPLIGLANRVALHWDFMLVVNPDQSIYLNKFTCI